MNDSSTTLSGFIKDLGADLNSNVTSVTENGASGFKHTKSPLVDLLYAAGSSRTMEKAEINVLVKEAITYDKDLATRLLFYLRDARGGVGERSLFHTGFLELAYNDIDLACCLLKYIPEYGSWKDIIVIVDRCREEKEDETVYADLLDSCVDMIHNQLEIDMLMRPNMSLLAKWMPSINATSQKSRKTALYFIKQMPDLFSSNQKYRQFLARLRKHLDVVEVKMSARKWKDIDYAKVPSLANLRYKKAFAENDKLRRIEYLEALEKGETKINAGVLMPHEIVSQYTEGCGYSRSIIKKDVTFEEMWKALSATTPMFDKNLLVVRDGSGSMLTPISKNSSARALDVSTALAIYTAEKLTGPWHNKFITFSAKPEMITLPGTSLRDALQICASHDDCSNTDIAKVFNLVLRTACNSKLEQKDVPDILIISDMEFDNATTTNSSYWGDSEYDSFTTLFEKIGKHWEAVGYKMPRLIFWNVNSRSRTVSINENSNGVILLGGFSKNLLEMVMSNETNPEKALIKTLNGDRYAMNQNEYLTGV